MQRKLDLRTGRPVWMAYRARVVPTQKLARDLTTDVLVIGMGISGALAASSKAIRIARDFCRPEKLIIAPIYLNRFIKARPEELCPD